MGNENGLNLPQVCDPERYIGLYVVDFGESCSVGFTAVEVAELLEIEKFGDVKVYKIHKAYPDGRMELKGVGREIFGLEMGMFFGSCDLETARGDYRRLVDLGVRMSPPGRAKVHLAKFEDGEFCVGLIYPAEYNDEFSRWLIDGDYRTSGQVHGGVEAVTGYYNRGVEVLENHQLFGESSYADRTGQELLAASKLAVQR